MMRNNLPPGWSEDRVRRIVECYTSGAESDSAEGETAFEYEVKEDIDEVMELAGGPRILLVGCGGAGNNTGTRIHDIGIDGIDILAIDTNKQDLDRCRADKKILIGKSITRGLGAGGCLDVGRRAAELARGTLCEVLADYDLVFVTAGIGGGTGTGIAPVVAEIARDNGAIVVGIVSTPFYVECARITIAEKELRELSTVTHTLIVLDNNCLLNYMPNLPMSPTFSVMDQLISETVKNISDLITKPSLDLAYVGIRTILSGGAAVLLFGESQTRDKSSDVVRSALNHPLLDVDYRGATGCLVHITCGPELTLQEAEWIASSLTDELSPSTIVTWSARVAEEYEGGVRVMAIMTGVESARIVLQEGLGHFRDNASRHTVMGIRPEFHKIGES